MQMDLTAHAGRRPWAVHRETYATHGEHTGTQTERQTDTETDDNDDIDTEM